LKKSENLKNVKRVCPKTKIKGKKECNGKKMKEMNHKSNRRGKFASPKRYYYYVFAII